MNVVVNGKMRSASDGATVDALVATLSRPRRGIAVALNGEVVPRSEWETTTLGEGDKLEVLGAVGGG